jgi:DNA-binding transcriptional regulator YdaS (Cro superfamily)
VVAVVAVAAATSSRRSHEEVALEYALMDPQPGVLRPASQRAFQLANGDLVVVQMTKVPSTDDRYIQVKVRAAEINLDGTLRLIGGRVVAIPATIHAINLASVADGKVTRNAVRQQLEDAAIQRFVALKTERLAFASMEAEEGDGDDPRIG